MPLPGLPLPAPKEDSPSGGHATHYFDAAHGDVALLHERIERGFACHSLGQSPVSPTARRLDWSIELLSRGAGVAGLIGTLILIAILVF